MFTHYALIAGLACACSERQRAVAALRRALEGTVWQIEREAARHALGMLLGGDKGAALVSDAQAFFAVQGVRDVEQYANRVLLPGLEIKA